MSDILNITKAKLEKSIVSLKREFSKLVLNKSNLKLIEDINITYHDEVLKLNQLSVITFDGRKTVLIKPFDKSILTCISRAIINLRLDLNPYISNGHIKFMFPNLTMERREIFVKKVKKLEEEIKIAMRNIRRQSNQSVKSIFKSREISQDDERRLLSDIDDLIKEYIKKAESLTEEKKKNLLMM